MAERESRGYVLVRKNEAGMIFLIGKIQLRGSLNVIDDSAQKENEEREKERMS